MRVDPVVAASALNRMTKFGWFSPAGPELFVSFDFTTEVMYGYLDEKYDPAERQEDESSVVVYVFLSTFHVNCQWNVARETTPELQHDQEQCCGVVDSDTGFRSEFLAELADDPDHFFAKAARWKAGGGYFSSVNDRLGYCYGSTRAFKAFAEFGTELDDLPRNLVILYSKLRLLL